MTRTIELPITLTSELVWLAGDDRFADDVGPRIIVRFGDAVIAELPVPDADLHRVSADHGSPKLDDINEYVEERIAERLAPLFAVKNSDKTWRVSKK